MNRNVISIMCYVIENTCMSCGVVNEVKIKVCPTGKSGILCLRKHDKEIPNKLQNTAMVTNEDGRLCLDMRELMDITVAENQIMLCSCHRPREMAEGRKRPRTD